MTTSQREYYEDAKALVDDMRRNRASQNDINRVLLVACTALNITVAVPSVGKVFTPDNLVLINLIPEFLPLAYARELVEESDISDKAREFLNKAIDIARANFGKAYVTDSGSKNWDCSTYVNKALRAFFGERITKWISSGSSGMRDNMGGKAKKSGIAPLGWYSSTDYDSMQPGDILFWNGNADKKIKGHVAIYLGNGFILDCSSPEGIGIHHYTDYDGKPRTPIMAEFYRPDYGFTP